MKIWYKGVLCNTGTYRYMGEDKPIVVQLSRQKSKLFIMN